MTAPFFALVERRHQNWVKEVVTPPKKRMPFESTSGVPHWGALGMVIGFIQVNPPSVERLNSLGRKGWRYPKTGIGIRDRCWLAVLSTTNHCLSPPIAGAMFVKVWPPLSERHMVTSNDCRRLR